MQLITRKNPFMLVCFMLAMCFITVRSMQSQQPNPADQVITGKQLNTVLPAPPSPVQYGQAIVTGNSGPATYYYWLVSRNTVSNSQLAGPFIASSAPNTLSS